MKQLNKYSLLQPVSRTQDPKPQPRRVTKAVAELLKWTAPALLAISINANAAADCKVTLIATIDNQPAMQPTRWVITDNRTGDVTFEMTRHSGVIHIPCGNYTATVTLGDIIRTRPFTLMPTLITTVTMNMGSSN